MTPHAPPSASVSSSLLERLRDRAPDAWARLVHLYYPVVRRWGLRAGLQAEDAADVAQEVFRALAGNVGRFDRAGGRNSVRRVGKRVVHDRTWNDDHRRGRRDRGHNARRGLWRQGRWWGASHNARREDRHEGLFDVRKFRVQRACDGAGRERGAVSLAKGLQGREHDARVGAGRETVDG